MSERRVSRVIRYQTLDGKLHRDIGTAEEHATRLENIKAANEMLHAGATVADAARRAGYRVPEGSILDRMTGQTPLVVSHYQCRDEPGYKVTRIDAEGWFVFGDAGSWSGPYGNHATPGDVIRYAEDTERRHPELFQKEAPDA